MRRCVVEYGVRFKQTQPVRPSQDSSNKKAAWKTRAASRVSHAAKPSASDPARRRWLAITGVLIRWTMPASVWRLRSTRTAELWSGPARRWPTSHLRPRARTMHRRRTKALRWWTATTRTHARRAKVRRSRSMRAAKARHRSMVATATRPGSLLRRPTFSMRGASEIPRLHPALFALPKLPVTRPGSDRATVLSHLMTSLRFTSFFRAVLRLAHSLGTAPRRWTAPVGIFTAIRRRIDRPTTTIAAWFTMVSATGTWRPILLRASLRLSTGTLPRGGLLVSPADVLSLIAGGRRIAARRSGVGAAPFLGCGRISPGTLLPWLGVLGTERGEATRGDPQKAGE